MGAAEIGPLSKDEEEMLDGLWDGVSDDVDEKDILVRDAEKRAKDYKAPEDNPLLQDAERRRQRAQRG